jgi:RND family efflux transporter MFP subunit
LEGTYLQERQLIESEAFVAEENLNRAKEYYIYSQKLASKGYVNELQLEADRFAVEKAKKDLDTAKTKLHVLDEFTKPKMLSTLESAIQIAKAKWDSAQNSHELELEKLQEFDDQVAKCTIVAPEDGIVKYAHVTDGRGDQEFIVEEGAMVRERQVIITLPNADSMRVKLNVNESLIQYVRPGLAAVISPVGFGDRVLHGMVEQVNQYAEPTGWRQANVKDYKALVSIDEPSPQLRAGLTASVTVRCAQVPDALQVPVQAVYAHGNKFYCFVNSDGGWEAREIKPGPTNDKFFVIERGLNEGDQVAMSPRTYVDKVNLPKLSPEEAQRAVPQRGNGRPGAGNGRRSGGPSGEPGRRPDGGMPEHPPGTEPLEQEHSDEGSMRDTRVQPGTGTAEQARTASTASQGAAE